MTPHILVVDDDVGIRTLLEKVLEDEGLPVVTAGTGCEALDRISEDPPQLVLLDLQMPVMSGWEILRRLHDAHQPVPVVFMSTGTRVRMEAAHHHADGCLAKPFDLTQLLAVVARFAPSAAW